MKYTLYDEDGSEEVELPSHYEVCPRCEGKGSHDCWEGGMTGDEMAEQGPDFFEDYMSGMYDAKCTVCKGLRVVEVVDRDRLSPDLLARFDKAEDERRGMEAEMEMERRLGL
jgi:hypothetical protein